MDSSNKSLFSTYLQNSNIKNDSNFDQKDSKKKQNDYYFKFKTANNSPSHLNSEKYWKRQQCHNQTPQTQQSSQIHQFSNSNSPKQKKIQKQINQNKSQISIYNLNQIQSCKKQSFQNKSCTDKHKQNNLDKNMKIPDSLINSNQNIIETMAIVDNNNNANVAKHQNSIKNIKNKYATIINQIKPDQNDDKQIQMQQNLVQNRSSKAKSFTSFKNILQDYIMEDFSQNQKQQNSQEQKQYYQRNKANGLNFKLFDKQFHQELQNKQKSLSVRNIHSNPKNKNGFYNSFINQQQQLKKQIEYKQSLVNSQKYIQKYNFLSNTKINTKQNNAFFLFNQKKSKEQIEQFFEQKNLCEQSAQDDQCSLNSSQQSNNSCNNKKNKKKTCFSEKYRNFQKQFFQTSVQKIFDDEQINKYKNNTLLRKEESNAFLYQNSYFNYKNNKNYKKHFIESYGLMNQTQNNLNQYPITYDLIENQKYTSQKQIPTFINFNLNSDSYDNQDQNIQSFKSQTELNSNNQYLELPDQQKKTNIMDLQFISQNQENDGSKKQKRFSIDDNKYDQKQIFNQPNSQFQKEQNQCYSLDNKEKNSKKLWRLQEKKEKTQEQIINIIPLGKTFHTFGFNYNDNCDNYKVDGIMQNFSNQKNKGNLLISDLWPQKIQKNYLKQTNLDETRRFIVGMANGQKGINVVKNYQKKNSTKKPENFNKFKVISGYEQQKYMQKQEKNIITQIHQKVKYLEGGGIGPCEGQKEFQKIGIKNFTMKQEIIEQNGFINFLQQKIQQLGGDQQEAGQLYIYAVNKIKGRQMLTEIFNQIKSQSSTEQQDIIQRNLKKFNLEQLSQGFSKLFQTLIQIQSKDIQDNIVCQLYERLYQLYDSGDQLDQVNQHLNPHYLDQKQQKQQTQHKLQSDQQQEKLNKKDQMLIDEKKKFNIKLNKMMDKLKILEKDNLQDFQYIESKSKKMEDNMFKHAKSNSKWSNIYDGRNIINYQQKQLEKLEQQNQNLQEIKFSKKEKEHEKIINNIKEIKQQLIIP